MIFRATWPIEDTDLGDAILIAEAEADLPNVTPDGYELSDLRWSIEGGHVCLLAEATLRTFRRCGHARTTDNLRRKCDGRGAVSYVCRECYRKRERERKAQRKAERQSVHSLVGRNAGPRLPAAPLLAYIESRQFTNLPVPDERAIKRAREKGWISLYVADRIACTTGIHPGLIWSEWWELEEVA